MCLEIQNYRTKFNLNKITFLLIMPVHNIWVKSKLTSWALYCKCFICYQFSGFFFYIYMWRISVGLQERSWWSRPPCRGIGRAGMLTSESQDVVLSADSEPAAAGPGWTLSGHGLVSADWLAGPNCKIPVPGTQMETNTAAADVRRWGE